MNNINSRFNDSVYHPIEKKNLKRKADVHREIEPKIGRKITRYEQNLAPSVSKVKNLADGIREHAYLRIQMFYAVALKLEGVAKRTNRSSTNVKVWVGRATKQDGQGTRSEHAAHSNAAAGLRDDLKEHYIQQIIEQGMTPVKASALRRIRNMSRDDLDKLQKNHTNEKFVRDVMELVWPGNSVIAYTEFEDQINATDKLPRMLNLGCDLTLEKAIRPYIAELMMLVMKGELDPRKAADLYTEAIQNHFAIKLDEITNQIKTLKNAEMLDVEALKKWEEQLFFHQMQMNGTNSLNYDLFDGPIRNIKF